MKLAPLIRHFQTFLPKFTDLFTDVFDISDVSINTTTVTITTATPYSFPNNGIHIKGILVSFPIVAFSYDPNTGAARVETAFNNGLANKFNIKTREVTPLTVTLTGNSDSSLNGDFKLLDVPNRKIFVFQVPNSPASIVLDGQVINYAGRNPLSGVKEITPLTTTTFTFTVPNDLTDIVPVTTTTMTAEGNIRITGTVNEIRADELYTQKTNGGKSDDKFWLILVYGSNVTNKSRNILNSAIANTGQGTDARLILLEEFGAVVFAPTASSLTARNVRDQIEDVKLALFKSIMGFPTHSQYAINQNFYYQFTKANEITYNTAYIVYRFNFQAQYDIIFKDMFNEEPIVPFLDLDQSIKIGSEGAELINNIDLDQDPEATI